ncbi:glycosyl hydrolase [Mariniflexile ostreae]|uniref:Glycosyl hydrolase n=1 Tax=Mariniflexile ostreae TaxID=1520892 RepID=A0ABV5F9I1_9FLAO
MKKIQFVLTAILFSFCGFAQTTPCGTVINNTFDADGTLPNGWTEYNTSGRVTVKDGKLKFDHNATMPSAYCAFTPTSSNSAFSFDVSASRNSVNCQIHLISSMGKYLSSIAVGIDTATIKYATTMEGGVPSGFVDGLPVKNFPTNTIFTLSTQVDFTTNKVNFYNNGELVFANASFLEDAKDIAKIDIQLMYMYANNGQFYFDNISLLNGDENRLLLTGNVALAENKISTVTIGNKYEQYSQTSVDAFEQVINDTNAVLDNCEATSAEVDNAILNLQDAQEDFKTAQVNDPVLKLYSGYNFSGEEHEMYCGFYNGTLAEYDDWAVSFTLEKGYMVTFAENINGTGVSKVYVASNANLSINLPENLQQKASFIRVSPWNDIHKKGIGAKGTDVVASLNNSWYYNWGTSGEAVGNAEFVPNQWGSGSIEKAISLGERMDITHYMAFNEPDNSDQSNMTVDKAIEKYSDLLASGLRLGSPAVTDGSKGAAWRDEFMTKAEAAGLRVDYIVVHYYKKTSAQGFYNWLKAIHDKWQRPIWIKEFNYGATWTDQPASNEAARDGLQAYMNMLDVTSFIERYAVFTWQPDKPVYSLMAVRNPITLSSSGIMYHDHQSPIAYTQEVYEQGPSLSVNLNSKSDGVSVIPSLIKNGVLNVDYSEVIEKNDVKLNIYNFTGQLVKNVIGSQSQINVSSLSSGIYIVKIELGARSFVQKIIIE